MPLGEREARGWLMRGRSGGCLAFFRPRPAPANRARSASAMRACPPGADNVDPVLRHIDSEHVFPHDTPVPAKVVGEAGCSQPSVNMDQLLGDS